jgi:hypothetical protein
MRVGREGFRLGQRSGMTPEQRGYVATVADAPRSPAAFIEWLVARHSDLAAIRNEHLRDYGELLPHVLFGDVTRYAAGLARSGADDATLDGLLNDLDSALEAGRDDEVGNLIAASCVENAQGIPGDAEEPLRARLQHYPHLAEALAHSE